MDIAGMVNNTNKQAGERTQEFIPWHKVTWEDIAEYLKENECRQRNSPTFHSAVSQLDFSPWDDKGHFNFTMLRDRLESMGNLYLGMILGISDLAGHIKMGKIRIYRDMIEK